MRAAEKLGSVHCSSDQSAEKLGSVHCSSDQSITDALDAAETGRIFII